VHVLTPSATVRRIFNMAALTVIDANEQEKRNPRP
jgi:phosphotransacetylase